MRPARSLAAALADSPAAGLLHKLERWRRIADIIAHDAERIAPDFNAHDPRACELREDELILNARSAAQAAKLRQGLPGLLKLLHHQGAQVCQIRVRVQPTPTGYPGQASATPTVAPITPPLPPSAAQGAASMARELVETLPDSPLKTQVQALQRALRKRLNG
ncbi:MAG: hypothetical protein ACK54C_04705 [Betaproteobacteria bacterium]